MKNCMPTKCVAVIIIIIIIIIISVDLGLGDDTRFWAPPYCGGQSTYFLAINRNKKVISLIVLNLC